ncbi:FtsK/SpoIIIE domain-containing protein [Microcoleus sp. D2_18a_D3]|uniref:FtsK/SpoIIIE domain-containing protein n=1 Tax=Microcoleus sp. D2_18a_D3 TaxID=3055330 RepID=UPI002FD3B56F
MTYQSDPICFEIYPQRTIQDNSRPTELRKNLLQTQQQLISSISRLGTNLTISLRYIYDPNQSPKLKTYLLIARPHNTHTEEHSEQILSLLTKGKLSQFFTLTPQPNLTPFQNLDWVQVIGKILKHEELIAPQNYYLPHLFEANQTNDMSAVCEVLHRLDSKLILEITLQTYHNPNQKSLWVNAINQMLAQLEKVNASTSGIKDNILSVTSALYQKYQQSYPNSDLFQYSIKALAENRADAFPVLDTLINHAIKETAHGKRCRIIQISKDKPGFSESLQATKNVDISSAIEWEGWHKNNSEMSISQAIQPQKKGLAKFGHSVPFPDKPSFNHQSQPPMIGGINSEQNPNLPQLYNAVSDGSGLAKLSSTPSPSRMVDLKPLHRLATVQEISGFFRIAVPKVDTNTFLEGNANQIPQEFIEVFTIEKVLRKYREKITEDTYVVGIAEDGKVCISDFSKIPHRIIAGETGSGKTNFVTSVIYQFLYANPSRQIYIVDFQAGLHYQFIVDQQPTVQMVTQNQDCAKLLQELWNEHEKRRQEMLTNRVRNLNDLKEKHGIIKDRILLIIDEAFYIKMAERDVKKTIETHLNNLAAQSRVTGIHIIYCSQTPTSDIIDSQTSNNMGEKVIFRINSSTDSNRLLGEATAASLPVEPKGRAIYKGLDGQPKLVVTPYVPDDIWENSLI